MQDGFEAVFCLIRTRLKFDMQEETLMKKYDMVIVGSGSGLMVMEAALNAGLTYKEVG
jgi:hypothetical protein